MQHNKLYDVIIIGGSFSGLSAALGLGRSLRSVLIIDASLPANRKSFQSQNFLTNDGESPDRIILKAKRDLNKYSGIHFYKGTACNITRNQSGFETSTESGDVFHSTKLLLTTGVTDLLPPIAGIAECWGKSFLHCPYCHGYEVRFNRVGVLGNGIEGFELARHIYQWTKKLTLFTNGLAMLSREQIEKLIDHSIDVVEDPITEVRHYDGKMEGITFKGGRQVLLSTLFGKAGFCQSNITFQAECLLDDHGYITVDEYFRTSVPGIYAAGDNVTAFRTISSTIAAGNKAGAAINKDLIAETF